MDGQNDINNVADTSINLDAVSVPDKPENNEMPSEHSIDSTSNVDTVDSNGNSTKKRTRKARVYPSQPFEESLALAQAIQQHSAGKPIRRLTLFDILGKSPDSSSSREWITSSAKYGLIKGSYSAEMLELTENGKIASSEEFSEYERTQAKVNLAVMGIAPFKSIYNEFVGNRFPSRQVLADVAKKYVSEEQVKEALDIFTVNIKFVGLLKIVSGTERLIKTDHLLETLTNKSIPDPINKTDSQIYEDEPEETTSVTQLIIAKSLSKVSALDDICFYIAPIGEIGSEYRLHSDLFLNHLIQPAIEEFGLKLVRADKIDKPGIIGKQIIRYLLRSKLVIADLSFHNPNVFYELAIRHSTKLPTVHIIRASDSIPFDVNQTRTIKIDSSSIYTFVPQLDTYKAEIATQVRLALEGEEDGDNPISIFYPSFKVSIE